MELIAEWITLDFDWDESQASTSRAYWLTQGYPNTSALAGIKVGFDGTIYVTVPRWKPGVPSTLNKLVLSESSDSFILKPFPSWDFNTVSLRNCQSMTIDSLNRMWILEVGRENFADGDPSTTINAPAGVIVLDLENNQVNDTLSYTFPGSVVPVNNSFLNDIALDLDRGFAYFTSTFANGLIVVYDFHHNESWSFTGPPTQRNSTFDFIVDGYNYGNCNGCVGSSPVDGIALSSDGADLYFSPVQGQDLWKIQTSVLRNRSSTKADFVDAAQLFGYKTGMSDGLLIIDNYLYYGDIMHSAIKKVSLDTQDVYTDSTTLGISEVDFRWPDTFAPSLDGSGAFHFVTNRLDTSFNLSMSFNDNNHYTNFHIWKYDPSSVTTSNSDTGSDMLLIIIPVVIGITMMMILNYKIITYCQHSQRKQKHGGEEDDGDDDYYNDENLWKKNAKNSNAL